MSKGRGEKIEERERNERKESSTTPEAEMRVF